MDKMAGKFSCGNEVIQSECNHNESVVMVGAKVLFAKILVLSSPSKVRKDAVRATNGGFPSMPSFLPSPSPSDTRNGALCFPNGTKSERESGRVRKLPAVNETVFALRRGLDMNGHGQKQRISRMSRSLRGRFRGPSLSFTQPS